MPVGFQITSGIKYQSLVAALKLYIKLLKSSFAVQCYIGRAAKLLTQPHGKYIIAEYLSTLNSQLSIHCSINRGLGVVSVRDVAISLAYSATM